MNYLLDTNAVVGLVKNRPPVVRMRLRDVVARGASLSVSTIVLHELWFGVARSERQTENAARLRAFLAGNIDIVDFEEADAVIAGELRAELASAGTLIGPYDVLIAAQALRSGLTLVTANTAEFARVRGLTWEDWAGAG